MTQENFNKAKELQEQLAKVTKEIEGSYLPDGFMYRGGEISYYISRNRSVFNEHIRNYERAGIYGAHETCEKQSQ